MIHAVYYCVLDSIMQIGIYRYYITLVIIGLMADSSGQYIMYPYRGDMKQFILVEIRITCTVLRFEIPENFSITPLSDY